MRFLQNHLALPLAVGLIAGALTHGTAFAQATPAAAPKAQLLGVTKAQPPASAVSIDALKARLAALVARQGDGAVLTSIAHVLDVAERIEAKFKTQSAEWRGRAEKYLAAVEQGKDPYLQEKGRIVSRGYRSPISQRVQGYTLYIPPGYDPNKAYPLMVVLHGGSSNGNLFLGVVLGNNMNWKEYDRHLWDTYEPKWSPDWIVAAADGYGQVLWRYMGEQDVLDVVADVKRNYQVDDERVVLSGLSNGGVGAYAIGSRHASEFSVVQAMAGAPSWRMYAGDGAVQPTEAALMRPLNAIDLAENWYNTDFRYYHGYVDPGPMRPAFIHTLDALVDQKKIPHKGKWYDAGHDLLYIVHRHGKVYDDLAPVRRNSHPAEVHVVSGDFRASKQHWLEITRFERYPDIGRLVGRASDGKLELSAENVVAFNVDLSAMPSTGTELEVTVNGARAFKGPRASLGKQLRMVSAGGFHIGAPDENGLQKRPGMSGPITDAYFDRMVHVYGTGRAENTEELRKTAQKGAHGWPLWLWTVDQEVIPDTEVTPELARQAHLVLYGTPGDNRVLDRIMHQLPIQVSGDAVVAGDVRYVGKGLGTRFIYPNPEAPSRYVIVNAAPTIDGVRRSHNLPDFVPDYVIYDASSTAARARLIPGKPPLARGFFDARWQWAPSPATSKPR